ncbi:MAG: LuxR C-terminal-related transcriptional regulator [Robiginitomaculum sp.]|nr:LuxR C-terminal-related transcriptional regulator [Robiginitomaculum sp.]MDQ7078454.1 LuxR C-terminal-related transcriptional regulator [Robiginitomaculum sp.]
MSAATQRHDDCLPEIILEIGRAPDTKTLVALFRHYLDENSLGPFTLAEICSAGEDWRKNLILGTIPNAYLEEYFATNSFFDSPTFRATQYSCKPVSFDKIFDIALLSRRGHKIYNRAKRAGFEHGYCFPLKGRSCRPTMMYISGDFKNIDAQALMLMEMVILAFYRRACDLFPGSELQGIRHNGGLSDRERETLSWVAQGKTDWEIAQLLEISERTVHYHIENAKKKMMVPTRLQAVVEAIRNLEILI